MINKCHTRYCPVCYRSSRLEVFCKKNVLRNFAKFTGKHLCQSLFFNKVADLRLFVVRRNTKHKKDENTRIERKEIRKKSRRNIVLIFIVFAFLSSTVEVGSWQKLSVCFSNTFHLLCLTATTFMKIFIKSFQE